MFDFKKLLVYQKAKGFCFKIKEVIATYPLDRTTRDQLRRASFSIMLNIAEGSSRFTSKDRKRFMVIARGSAFECAAILEYLAEGKELPLGSFELLEGDLEEISRMLFGLIQRLEKGSGGIGY